MTFDIFFILQEGEGVVVALGECRTGEPDSNDFEIAVAVCFLKKIKQGSPQKPLAEKTVDRNGGIAFLIHIVADREGVVSRVLFHSDKGVREVTREYDDTASELPAVDLRIKGA